MSDHHTKNDHSNDHKDGHHFVLPDKVAYATGGALGVLTIITVAIAQVDLGWLNFPVAFLIATLKATLVALFFMCLKYDKRENAVIFATSFVFLAIFITLTAFDLLFRGDVYVKKTDVVATTSAEPQFKKPWLASKEITGHGKELFAQQCVTCHGTGGAGDGVAGVALNPKPRNLTADSGWKKGRKPTQIWATLTDPKGLVGMPSFASLSPEDRWALVHYVRSLGPHASETDTASDYAKVGVDPSKDYLGAGSEQKALPVAFAIARMAENDRPRRVSAHGFTGQGLGAQVYRAQCLSCHGAQGQGVEKIKRLGANPVTYLSTPAFSAQSKWVVSEAAFSDLVVNGLPGNAMPGSGSLSRNELSELYRFVRSLAR